jgi:phenylacetate-CoA ligase
MRNLYAFAYDQAFYGGWQALVHRRPIAAHRRLLERTQWCAAEEVERLQVDELRKLLAHARQHVPYYRDLLARIGFDPRSVRSRADLEQIPVLTRETIREHAADLVDPRSSGRNVRKATSGTSGAPLQFEYSGESEAWRQAVRLRAYAWAGYRPGVPTLHYWAAGTYVPTGVRAVKTRIDRALRREVYLDAMRQDDQTMRSVAEEIARMRPSVVIGYAQALASFARWIIDRKCRAWHDIRVICAAEALLPGDRVALEDAFGPDVFETYGSRETMLVAAECCAHDGMHLSPENLVVELTRNGRCAGPGESGEVTVTDLHNYAMPFIRYLNGDEASWGNPGRCPCGRELPRLGRVEGRRCDTLRNKEGAPVPGIVFISHLVFTEDVVRQFQVVQKRAGEIVFKIVPGRDFSDEKFAAVARRLAAYFEGLPFHVVRVDQISADPSGKRRPIVVER